MISPSSSLSEVCVDAVFVTSIDELGKSIASKEDDAKSIQVKKEFGYFSFSGIQGQKINGRTIDILGLDKTVNFTYKAWRH